MPLQPVALVPRAAIQIAGAGVKRIFDGVVGDGVDVAGEHRVVGVAQQLAALAAACRSVVAEERILAEGIGDLHGAPAVGRVVDVDGRGAAQDVAVIPPHHHLPAVHVPRDLARERVEIPAGVLRVLRRMREVIRAVLGLDRNLPVTLEAVGAEVKLRAGGKENVSVLQDVAEGDALSVRKRQAARPGAAVVFRQKQHPLRVSERLVPALRVNVPARRLQAIPEVVRGGAP